MIDFLKKSSWRLLVLLFSSFAMVASFSAIYLENPRLLNALKSPLRIQAETAYHTFLKGLETGSHPRTSLLKECLNYSDEQQILFYEGYSFRKSTEVLKRLQTEAAVSPERLSLEDTAPSWPLSPILARDVFLTAFGMAVGQLRMDPMPFERQLKNQSLFPHIIDGWGLVLFLRSGYREARTTCETKFATTLSLREACLYGLGRGWFFVNAEKAPKEADDRIVYSGYLFAKSFTAHSDFSNSLQIASQNSTPYFELMAHLFKIEWKNPVQLEGRFTQLKVCLNQNHPLSCTQFRP